MSPTQAGVVLRLPRTCLADPYRIRVGVQLSTRQVSNATTARDDALRTARSIDRSPALSS